MCPRFKIEEKHTYYNSGDTIHGNVRDVYFEGAQEQVPDDVHSIIKFSTPYFPPAGVDENQRIGRKITSQSVVTEGFVRLFNRIDTGDVNEEAATKGTIFGAYSEAMNVTFQQINDSALSKTTPQIASYQDANVTPPVPVTPFTRTITVQKNTFTQLQQPLSVSIRHMFVEFDSKIFVGKNDIDIKRDLYKWYHYLVIQDGWYNTPSNRTILKRESTEFTGTFNILYDKVFYLSLENPMYHYQVTVPYKRNMNFDGDASLWPTSKIIMEIMIGPTNVYQDYGNMNVGDFIDSTLGVLDDQVPLYVADWQHAIKLNYLDL